MILESSCSLAKKSKLKKDGNDAIIFGDQRFTLKTNKAWNYKLAVSFFENYFCNNIRGEM